MSWWRGVLALPLVAGFGVWSCGCTGSERQAPSPEAAAAVSHRPAASPEEMASALQKAEAELAKKSYAAVLPLLTPYEGAPNAPLRLFEVLGDAYLNQAQFEKAEAALGEGLRRDLYSARIRELLAGLNYVRGRLAMEGERYGEARGFFDRAIVNTPKDQTLVDNIANLYGAEGRRLADLKRWRECAQVLGDAQASEAARRPANDLPLARALLASGAAAQAEAALGRYLQGRPDDVDALLLKGDALAAQKQDLRAMAVWKQVLKVDPENEEARDRLRHQGRTAGNERLFAAEEAIDAEEWERAAGELELALKTAPPADEELARLIHGKLGLVHARLNDYVKAQTHYRAALAGRGDDVDLTLELARVQRLARQFSEARGTLEGLLARHPEEPRIRLALADFFVRISLPASAIPHLEALTADRGVVSRDVLVGALDLLGVCYAERKQLDRAEEAWQTLLTIDRDNAKACYNLGSIYERQHLYGKAIEHFERAVQAAPASDPSLSRYLYWLALAFRQNGQLAQYRQTLDKILRVCAFDDPYRRKTVKFLESMGEEPGPALAPSAADLPVVEADKAAQRGELDVAQQLYQRVLEAQPPAAPEAQAAALRGLGALEASRRRPDQAAVFQLRSLALLPEDRASLLRLGEAFEAMGLAEDAVDVYGRAARVAAGDQQVGLQLARALTAAGRLDEAMVTLDRVVNRDPASMAAEQAKRMLADLTPRLLGAPADERRGKAEADGRRRARALRRLGGSLAAAGLTDLAQTYLRRATELGGVDVESLLADAKALDRDGKREEALATLGQAAALAQNDARVLLAQAVVLFRLNRAAEAEALLRRVLEVEPANVEAALSLADLCRQSGRSEDGRRVLEGLLQAGVPAEAAEQVRQVLKTLGAS